MNVEIIVLVGSFLTGISGMIIALYTAFSSASRGELEAVVKENSRLRDVIDKLEKKVDHLEHENEKLKRWADKLVRQVVRTGGTPEEFED